jgi:hypothetical protein
MTAAETLNEIARVLERANDVDGDFMTSVAPLESIDALITRWRVLGDEPERLERP